MTPRTRRRLQELKTMAIYTFGGYVVMSLLAAAVMLAEWMIGHG